MSFLAIGPYNAYVIAVPTPSSDNDRMFRISVNRPLIPTYPSLKTLVNTTLVRNPISIANIRATIATDVFITEYSVLVFCSNFLIPSIHFHSISVYDIDLESNTEYLELALAVLLHILPPAKPDSRTCLNTQSFISTLYIYKTHPIHPPVTYETAMQILTDTRYALSDPSASYTQDASSPLPTPYCQ